MTGPEAIALIDELGIAKARFARMARLSPNALTKWMNGAQPHGPAVSLLLLLRARPELIAVLESMIEAAGDVSRPKAVRLVG
jgi:DNA-binding transcriptional regulator YiaG